MAQTLLDRIWGSHLVREEGDEPALLYVDLHLVHEVTSPQAFEGLRLVGRRVRRPDLTLATMDHNVPTDRVDVRDPLARRPRRSPRRCTARAVSRGGRRGHDPRQTGDTAGMASAGVRVRRDGREPGPSRLSAVPGWGAPVRLIGPRP